MWAFVVDVGGPCRGQNASMAQDAKDVLIEVSSMSVHQDRTRAVGHLVSLPDASRLGFGTSWREG